MQDKVKKSKKNNEIDRIRRDINILQYKLMKNEMQNEDRLKKNEKNHNKLKQAKKNRGRKNNTEYI